MAVSTDIAASAAAIRDDWRDGFADLMLTVGRNDRFRGPEEAARVLFGSLMTRPRLHRRPASRRTAGRPRQPEALQGRAQDVRETAARRLGPMLGVAAGSNALDGD